MRVTGNAGGGAGWPGRGSAQGSRARFFRRDYRVGQVVRGVVLRPETGETGQALFAWLRIDDHELLADVGRSVVPGEAMLLRIEALEPDIVLRELRGGVGDPGDGPSLPQLASAFRAERDRFEAMLSQAHGWPEAVLAASGLPPSTGMGTPEEESGRASPCPNPTHQGPCPDKAAPGLRIASEGGLVASRRERFNALVVGDEAIMESYLRVLGHELALDACLRGAAPAGFADGHGPRFAYCPWLLPGFRECELLVSAPFSPAGDGQSMRELRLAFVSPDFGSGELRLLIRPPQAGYRILLASPRAARVLSTALRACAETLARDVAADFLGVYRLDGPAGLSALLDPGEAATYGRRV